jgi:hypothetical protein
MAAVWTACLCVVASALVTSPFELRRFLGANVSIAAGPIAIWFHAVARGWLPDALGLLIPGTIVWLVPAALYARTRKVVWLGGAGTGWVASGVLFGVAIWT